MTFNLNNEERSVEGQLELELGLAIVYNLDLFSSIHIFLLLRRGCDFLIRSGFRSSNV